jgi:hypothetical protein
MDTQVEVKEFVQKSAINVRYMYRFNDKVLEIIDKGLEDVQDENLKLVARQTLLKFAQKEYLQLCKMFGYLDFAIYLATATIDIRTNIDDLQKQVNQKIRSVPLSDLNKGYSQLGNSQAKVSFGQSLYGRAELQARYNEQQDMLNNLKATTRLVICDTHSDCSKRCSEWQGGIYSLDGTYGITEDGREFRPLEVATENTKYGRNNGLLGYNCRHKLHPYKTGMKAISVNEKERQRESALSEKQRWYERQIRKAKENAILCEKGKNNNQFSAQQHKWFEAKYHHYKGKAEALRQEYVEFCHNNNRVEYRSRLKI